MSDPNDPLSWVVKAEEDYEVARSALRRKKPFTYTACFHAQQCAEKYLKALLVADAHPFSKTHDLLTLNDECARRHLVIYTRGPTRHSIFLCGARALSG